jgi:hypothetical protein
MNSRVVLWEIGIEREVMLDDLYMCIGLRQMAAFIVVVCTTFCGGGDCGENGGKKIWR